MKSPSDDGGPAFPRPVGLEPRTYDGQIWSPVDDMSLRDWFAGQALTGMMVGVSGLLDGEPAAYAKGHCNAVMSNRAYAVADAMLRARKQ